MSQDQNSKPYDLEERTFRFAKECRLFVKGLLRSIGNIEDAKQLIRSSGSVHANFIESVESLSKKDSLHRIRICRKEAKETRSWLRLVDCNADQENNRNNLIQEVSELMRIFGSIITKSSKI